MFSYAFVALALLATLGISPNEQKKEQVGVSGPLTAPQVQRILEELSLKPDPFGHGYVVTHKAKYTIYIDLRGKHISAKSYFTKYEISLARMNEWNSKETGTVAFFSRDGFALGSTHLLSGGVTKKNVREWLSEYLSNLEQFEAHIGKDERTKLEKRITIRSIDKSIPILLAITSVSSQADVKIRFDTRAIEKAGLGPVTFMTFGGIAAQREVSLKEVLDKMLRPIGLTIQATRDEIVVVPVSKEKKGVEQKRGPQ